MVGFHGPSMALGKRYMYIGGFWDTVGREGLEFQLKREGHKFGEISLGLLFATHGMG